MIATKQRILIIDANSLIHRAFHALPEMTANNKPVNAVYGFLLLLFKAIRELEPAFIVAAFDLPKPTFRHEQFKEYKATRPKTPEELSAQFPTVKNALRSFNIPFFEKEGYEADDIIGTIAALLARNAKSGGERQTESIILSGDLDTLQLVGEATKVYTSKRGFKETILWGSLEIKERYGLEPEQLVDFKGLKGDQSDNIPGVPGVGEKTAAKLIKTFGSLNNLYDAIENEKDAVNDIRKSTKAKLLEYRDQAFFSRELCRIRKDVSLDFNLEESKWDGYNSEKAIEFLKSMGFISLISRLPSLGNRILL